MILRLWLRSVPGIDNLFIDDLTRVNIFISGDSWTQSCILRAVAYFFRFALNRSLAYLSPSPPFDCPFSACGIAPSVEIGLTVEVSQKDSRWISDMLCAGPAVLADRPQLAGDSVILSVLICGEPRHDGYLCYTKEIGHGKLVPQESSVTADGPRILSLDARTAESLVRDALTTTQRQVGPAPNDKSSWLRGSQLQQRASAVFAAICRMYPFDLRDIESPIGRGDAEYLLELKAQGNTQSSYTTLKSWMSSLFGAELDVSVSGDGSLHVELDHGAVSASQPSVRQGLRLMLDLTRRPTSITLLEHPDAYFGAAQASSLLDFMLRVISVPQVFVTTASDAFIKDCPHGHIYLVKERNGRTATETLSLPTLKETIPQMGIQFAQAFFRDALVFVEDWRQESALRDLARDTKFDINALNVQFVRAGECLSALDRLQPATLDVLLRLPATAFFVVTGQARTEAQIKRLLATVPAERLLLLPRIPMREGSGEGHPEQSFEWDTAGENPESSATQAAVRMTAASLAAYTLTRHFVTSHDRCSPDLIAEEEIDEGSRDKFATAYTVLSRVRRLLKEKAGELSDLEAALTDLSGPVAPDCEHRPPGDLLPPALPARTPMLLQEHDGEGSEADRWLLSESTLAQILAFLRRIHDAAFSRSLGARPSVSTST